MRSVFLVMILILNPAPWRRQRRRLGPECR